MTNFFVNVSLHFGHFQPNLWPNFAKFPRNFPHLISRGIFPANPFPVPAGIAGILPVYCGYTNSSYKAIWLWLVQFSKYFSKLKRATKLAKFLFAYQKFFALNYHTSWSLEEWKTWVLRINTRSCYIPFLMFTNYPQKFKDGNLRGVSKKKANFVSKRLRVVRIILS